VAFVALDCVYRNNSALSKAGAIHATDYSRALLQGCHFVNNSVAHGEGGAMLLEEYSCYIINDCQFHFNSASSGGALYSNAQLGPFVSNSYFELNSASLSGGALLLGSNGDSVFEDCYCRFNTAANGGCMCVQETAYVVATNMTVSNNGALTSGGGVIATELTYLAFESSSFS
jgi:hypothetical protein